MAKTTTSISRTYVKLKKSRPGVHSKNGTSKLKKSKCYQKTYKKQGR